MTSDIQICKKIYEDFYAKTSDIALEPRGMTRNELLLVNAVVNK